MRRASLALLCLALGWGAVEPVGAQTSLASLERRYSQRPDDPSLLCQLGWARYLDGQSGSVAATPLDRHSHSKTPRPPSRVSGCRPSPLEACIR